MERDIVLNWYYEHAPARVWDCLTDSQMLAQWLMPNDFKPVLGHKFTFVTKPIPAFGWDGIIYSEVLELIPEKKLVYSWRSGPKPGVTTMDTVLVWTLTPKGNGTSLQLEHKGFKGMKNYMASLLMEKGWKKGIAKRFAQKLDSYEYEQK